MNLSKEQAYRLASMIKPNVVLEYINDHQSEYEEWLKEEKIKTKKEEFKNANKICKIKGKQTTND